MYVNTCNQTREHQVFPENCLSLIGNNQTNGYAGARMFPKYYSSSMLYK